MAERQDYSKFNGFTKAIVLDTETTGKYAYEGAIVEVAAILVDFSKDLNTQAQCPTFVQRFNPGMPIPMEASDVHGIYDEDVTYEPYFRDKAWELREFLGDYVIIGHNIRFDLRFLAVEFKRAGVAPGVDRNTYRCTMRRFKQQFPGHRYRLDDVARDLGVEGRTGQYHGALEDAIIAARVAGVFYTKDNHGYERQQSHERQRTNNRQQNYERQQSNGHGLHGPRNGETHNEWAKRVWNEKAVMRNPTTTAPPRQSAKQYEDSWRSTSKTVNRWVAATVIGLTLLIAFSAYVDREKRRKPVVAATPIQEVKPEPKPIPVKSKPASEKPKPVLVKAKAVQSKLPVKKPPQPTRAEREAAAAERAERYRQQEAKRRGDNRIGSYGWAESYRLKEDNRSRAERDAEAAARAERYRQQEAKRQAKRLADENAPSDHERLAEEAKRYRQQEARRRAKVGNNIVYEGRLNDDVVKLYDKTVKKVNKLLSKIAKAESKGKTKKALALRKKCRERLGFSHFFTGYYEGKWGKDFSKLPYKEGAYWAKRFHELRFKCSVVEMFSK